MSTKHLYKLWAITAWLHNQGPAQDSVQVRGASCVAYQPRSAQVLRLEMNWSTNRSQRATFFDIATPQGGLTVVLASKDEIESMSLYHRIHAETGKVVLHIAAAAGRAHANYPIDAMVHACPMHHRGHMRSDGVMGFWDACQETAGQGEAVAIHCNNSFHRGPCALLAVMVLAGYNKDIAMAIIAKRRCVYPGHTVPFPEWPRGERESKHADDLLRCHAWIKALKPNAILRKNHIRKVSTSRSRSPAWQRPPAKAQTPSPIQELLLLRKQHLHEALRPQSCTHEALHAMQVESEPDATCKMGKALLLMRETFDKGASHAMKARLNSEEIWKTYEEQFKRYDENGDGTIDARVFGQAIHAVSAGIAEVDLGDGLLRFHDFVILKHWLEWGSKAKKKALQRGKQLPANVAGMVSRISHRGVHIEVTSPGQKGIKGLLTATRKAKRQFMVGDEVQNMTAGEMSHGFVMLRLDV